MTHQDISALAMTILIVTSEANDESAAGRQVRQEHGSALSGRRQAAAEPWLAAQAKPGLVAKSRVFALFRSKPARRRACAAHEIHRPAGRAARAETATAN